MRSEIEIKKKNEISSDTSLSDQYVSKDMEPDILNCTNIPLYDLKLFQEAQGIAAEKIVSTFILTSSNKYFINFALNNSVNYIYTF